MSHSPICLVLPFALLFGSVSCSTTRAPDAAASHSASGVPATQALARLKSGNKRFVSGSARHPNQSISRRSEVAGGQHPFAVVLDCSDSRTPPELIFDQGLGDLFVVRVAGNVLNDENTGSIEYAVEHLGPTLIVVLGHERCGAVKAAKETIAARGMAPGHIESLVKAIGPAVKSTVGQDAEATCAANVRNGVKALQKSKPIIKEMVDAGKVTVVGAYYHLDSGKVDFYND